MSRDPQSKAGSTFAAALEDDPAAKAAWERARTRLQVFARSLSSIERSQTHEPERTHRALTDAIRDALRASGQALAAAGFEAPRTIEDWEHLAHIAEMPFETIRSGSFTLADVRAVALAWAHRERMKAGIAAKAREAGTETADRSDPTGDDDESEPPALTANEAAVLHALATFDPTELASAARIEATMESDVRLSERSIGPIIRRLIELHLAERPQGIRSGARLTLAGRRLARKIAG